MKKASLSLVLLFVVLTAAQAKTTYIPTYRSYEDMNNIFPQ